MAAAAVLAAAAILAAGRANVVDANSVQIGPDGSVTNSGPSPLVRRGGSGRLVRHAEGSLDRSGSAGASLLQEGSAGGAEASANHSNQGTVFAAVFTASGAGTSGKLLAEEHMVHYMEQMVLPVSTDCKIDLVKACQVLDVNKDGKLNFDELKRSLHFFDPRSDWNWKTKVVGDLSCGAFSSLVQEFLTLPPPGVCDTALVNRGCGVLNLNSTEHYGSPADDDPTIVHAKEIAQLLSTPAGDVVSALKSMKLANEETDSGALALGAFAVSCKSLCEKSYASLKQSTRNALTASNRACAAESGRIACNIDVSREKLYLEEQCSKLNLPGGFEQPVAPQGGLLEGERLEERQAFQGYDHSGLARTLLNMFNVYPPTDAAEAAVGSPPQSSLQTTPNGTLLAFGADWGHGSTIALLGGHSQKWCADEGDKITCNRDAVGGWERFRLEDAGGGKWALRGGRYNKYCADESHHIRCNRNAIGAWEKFTFGTISGESTARSLRGGKDNKYCADERNTIKCNRNGVGAWERFDIMDVDGTGDFHNLIYRRMATAQAWVTKVIQETSGGGGGNHMTTWFGNNNADTRTTVIGNINNVNSDMMNLYPEFDNVPHCGSNRLAYVHPGSKHNGRLMVWFCDHLKKFDANVQTRTIIHEVVHHPPSNTDDVVYGWNECKDLARRDPSGAQRNADSYENFCQDLAIGDGGGGGGCFPMDAKVQVKGGSVRELHELKAGDLIAVADPGSGEVRYEPFLGDFHSDLEHQRQLEYVTVVHELGTVSASAAHYVHTLERGFSPAGDLRVGDTLSTWHGTGDGVRQSRVVALSRQTKVGMYAPFTSGGTLLVDGVLVSAYTADEFRSFLSPRAQDRVLALLGGHDGVHRLMHVLALPLRLAHYVGLPALAKWGAELAVPGASAVGRIFSPGVAESGGADGMPLYVNWVGRAVGSILEVVV